MDSCLCRICATEKSNCIKIFEEQNYSYCISTKIVKYLQIEISEKDLLPKNICWDCFTLLEQYSNFVELSHEAQLILINIFSSYNIDEVKEENIYSLDSCYSQNDISVLTNSVNDQSEEVTGVSNIDNFAIDTISNEADDISNCLEAEEKSENNETFSLFINQNNILINKPSLEIPDKLVGRKINGYESKNESRKGKITRVTNDLQKSDADVNGLYSEIFKEKYFREIDWLCSTCDSKFQTLIELEDHHSLAHKQNCYYMCPFCYKVYTRYKQFVVHVKNHRDYSDFVCNACNKTFECKKLLNTHMKVHSETSIYKCTECDKTFKTPTYLRVHKRKHITPVEPIYKCKECCKRFSTKQNLSTHMLIHDNVKNYMCDHCGMSFVQKGNLVAHLGTHEQLKTYTCEICAKKFKFKVLLKKHLAVHNSVKCHQCDVCGKTFRERKSLQDHYRTHTGVTPYKCEFCEKTFKYKSPLTVHRRQHTGEKPYTCHHCQHKFTNWSNYNKHLLRRHGKKSKQPLPLMSNKEFSISVDTEKKSLTDKRSSLETMVIDSNTTRCCSYNESSRLQTLLQSTTIGQYDTDCNSSIQNISNIISNNEICLKEDFPQSGIFLNLESPAKKNGCSNIATGNSDSTNSNNTSTIATTTTDTTGTNSTITTTSTNDNHNNNNDNSSSIVNGSSISGQNINLNVNMSNLQNQFLSEENLYLHLDSNIDILQQSSTNKSNGINLKQRTRNNSANDLSLRINLYNDLDLCEDSLLNYPDLYPSDAVGQNDVISLQQSLFDCTEKLCSNEDDNFNMAANNYEDINYFSSDIYSCLQTSQLTLGNEGSHCNQGIEVSNSSTNNNNDTD